VKVVPKKLPADVAWLAKPANSGAYRQWLIDDGSLTSRLQLLSNTFAVKSLSQRNARPQIDEAVLLGLQPRRYALLREVYLYCENRPVVFAHSVLPHASLRGDWQKLGGLGARPLGAALFADPRVVRTPLSYCKLSSHHALFARATAVLEQMPGELWARRSVFLLKNWPILVTEVFLPEVLKL
jgi:chorismate--pyruvate lyase